MAGGVDSKVGIFSILAAITVLVGTVVTTIYPLFREDTRPKKDYVKPYTAVELEGRDIYIREGCNNCHTQTVRPLRTEVLRYGDYSKPEEAYYDRPFLWGSRRTGPDLAREAEIRPDPNWHYKHMNDPQSMFEKSNMPDYAFLGENKQDFSYSFLKTQIQKFGFTEEEVKKQIEDFKAEITSPNFRAKAMRDKVIPKELQGEITEMDAIIAYLLKLGRDFKEFNEAKRKEAEAKNPELAKKAEIVIEETNPLAGKEDAVTTGLEAYKMNCASCHGENAVGGGIGPSLVKDLKKGNSDKELFKSIAVGYPDKGMPAWNDPLGKEKIWSIITYIRSLQEK